MQILVTILLISLACAGCATTSPSSSNIKTAESEKGTGIAAPNLGITNRSDAPERVAVIYGGWKLTTEREKTLESLNKGKVVGWASDKLATAIHGGFLGKFTALRRFKWAAVI
jgi:ABC-type Fe3+-hydroxamate transport system substrate-binding protein